MHFIEIFVYVLLAVVTVILTVSAIARVIYLVVF